MLFIYYFFECWPSFISGTQGLQASVYIISYLTHKKYAFEFDKSAPQWNWSNGKLVCQQVKFLIITAEKVSRNGPHTLVSEVIPPGQFEL